MGEQIEYKTVGATIKQAGDEGTFEAVIATFGEVDKDGDIIAPGAFGDATAAVLPAHLQQHVPLGKAQVLERDGRAVASGRFNLEIKAAQDWHSSLKFDLDNPPAVQEWSWGFTPSEFSYEERDGEKVRILQKVDLREISPVLRGASIGSGTLSVKAEKGATARHTSETSDAAWDGPAQERKLPSPVPVADARKAYAWIDESKIEDGKIVKAACRFIHHFINSDGSVGAASTRGGTTGIAVLNGARGGTNIPAGDKQGVYTHMAGHLKDADIEPPELRKEENEAGLRLKDQVQLATWDVEAAIARLRAVSADRELGKEAKAVALEMAEQHARLMIELKDLAAGILPEDRAARAYANFLATEARLRGA